MDEEERGTKRQEGRGGGSDEDERAMRRIKKIKKRRISGSRTHR